MPGTCSCRLPATCALMLLAAPSKFSTWTWLVSEPLRMICTLCSWPCVGLNCCKVCDSLPPVLKGANVTCCVCETGAAELVLTDGAALVVTGDVLSAAKPLPSSACIVGVPLAEGTQ